MNWEKWFVNQDILGPILTIFLTVIIVKWFLPLLRKGKEEANLKLSKFYNTAYAFVKMRDGFSIAIDGKIHNKENCGEFHSFLSNNQFVGNVLFEEQAFFNFVNNNYSYINPDLSSLFVDYFKVRFPETVQNRIGCESSKMIDLRKEIERKIVEQYQYYKRILGI